MFIVHSYILALLHTLYTLSRLDEVFTIWYKAASLKAHANGRNKCQHLPTSLRVVGQQCCVRLHGPKSLTGLKLYTQNATSACQQVPTLLWFHENGRKKSQNCWAQKCLVLLANNVGSVSMGLKGCQVH